MSWVKVAGLHIPMLGTVDIPNFRLDTAPRHVGLGEHEVFTESPLTLRGDTFRRAAFKSKP